jgi:hypothetical protein
MSPLKLLLIVPLAVAGPVLAQGKPQQGVTTTKPQSTIGRARTPVATQPSNNPFYNPIGQGVPPAVSADSNRNSNRTNVPR